jgi:hypothetical protein
MKFAILTLAVVAISASAHASAIADTHTCKGNESFGTSKNVTMEISSIGKVVQQVPEGEKVPYHLIVKIAGKQITDSIVQVSQEDVMFQISGNTDDAGKVNGTIFLDELEQSNLNLPEIGLSFNLDCNEQF